MLFLWSSVLLCGVLVSFDFVPFCSWCFFFFLQFLVLFSLVLLLGDFCLVSWCFLCLPVVFSRVIFVEGPVCACCWGVVSLLCCCLVRGRTKQQHRRDTTRQQHVRIPDAAGVIRNSAA